MTQMYFVIFGVLLKMLNSLQELLLEKLADWRVLPFGEDRGVHLYCIPKIPCHVEFLPSWKFILSQSDKKRFGHIPNRFLFPNDCLVIFLYFLLNPFHKPICNDLSCNRNQKQKTDNIGGIAWCKQQYSTTQNTTPI